MAYGIMRLEKRHRQAVGGLEAEANRTEADRERKHFVGSDIEWDRTNENVRVISSGDWWQDIKAEIDRAGVKTVRKDAVVMLDAIYTASPDFFEGKDRDDITKYFLHCLAYHKHEFGHVVNAVIHFDEATPHMHVCSVPLTKDGRLSAKDVMGNKAAYHKRQDRYYELVSKEYGLERGEVREHGQERKHIDQMAYKAQQAEKRCMRAEEVEAVELKKPLLGSKVKVDYKEQERLLASAKHVQKAAVIVHNHNKIIRSAEHKADRMLSDARERLSAAQEEASRVIRQAEEEAARMQHKAYMEQVPELTALTNENRQLKQQLRQYENFIQEQGLADKLREFMERIAAKARSLGRSR